MAKIPTLSLRPNPIRRTKRKKVKRRRRARTGTRRRVRRTANPSTSLGHVVEVIARSGRGLHFSYLTKGGRRVDRREHGERFRTEAAATRRAKAFLKKPGRGVIGARVIKA